MREARGCFVKSGKVNPTPVAVARIDDVPTLFSQFPGSYDPNPARDRLEKGCRNVVQSGIKWQRYFRSRRAISFVNE
jgi:hypothetical protein